jgi:hypothetical protein
VRVAVKVGELARLTAKPDDETEPDWEKWAFAWQVPDGLSWQPDSNRREAIVTSAKPGEYRVLVVMARNGDPRPLISRAEMVVVVGGAVPEPAKPDTSDDVAKAKAAYPNLMAVVKTAGEAADADTRKALAGAYSAVAAAIKSGQLQTNDAVQRELTAQLAVPTLGTAAGQKLVLAVADAVSGRVKNADKLTPAEQRLLFLAVAEGLASR